MFNVLATQHDIVCACVGQNVESLLLNVVEYPRNHEKVCSEMDVFTFLTHLARSECTKGEHLHPSQCPRA